MRALVGGLAFGLCAALATCAPSNAEPQQASQSQNGGIIAPPQPDVAPIIIGGKPAPPPATTVPAPTIKLACTGPATQGGAILCLTDPGAKMMLGGKPVATADAKGLAVIGLPRAQDSPASVSAEKPGEISAPYLRPVVTASIEVLARKDTVTSFEMECNKIAAQTEEEKKKAEVAWLKKDAALKLFSAPQGPLAMAKPVSSDFGLTSSFGATRTYVPKTKDCEATTNVHNGTDIAVPTGTEIHAPMAGTVILADPDLYYEGGAVFLDLGRGLVSVTMHMSRIDVKAGQVVKQGELLGLSGATGRVTGPHLHWAIKYRNPYETDRGTDIWLDPVLMMQLDSSKLIAN